MILVKKTCNFFISALILFLCCSCSSGNKQNTSTDIFQDAQEIKLEGENVYLKIPPTFKRTSRYKLESHFPHLKDDADKLRVMQKMMHLMEFDDAELDVFYDEAADFSILIISNSAKSPINEQFANMLDGALNKRYSALQSEEAGLSIEKVDSKMKNSKNLQMMKFKHRFDYSLLNMTYFQSVTFMNTAVRTIAVVEITDEEGDIEDYLWSIKDR